MTDDIKALVAELRAQSERVRAAIEVAGLAWGGDDLPSRAADAIEALEAENESLRIDNLGHVLGHTDAMLRTRLERAEEAARTNAAEADAALKSLKKAERKLRRVENT